MTTEDCQHRHEALSQRLVETEPLDFADPDVYTYVETTSSVYPRGYKVNFFGAIRALLDYSLDRTSEGRAHEMFRDHFFASLDDLARNEGHQAQLIDIEDAVMGALNGTRATPVTLHVAFETHTITLDLYERAKVLDDADETCRWTLPVARSDKRPTLRTRSSAYDRNDGDYHCRTSPRNTDHFCLTLIPRSDGPTSVEFGFKRVRGPSLLARIRHRVHRFLAR